MKWTHAELKRRILIAVAEGLSNDQIAKQVNLHRRTVELHLTECKRALNAHSRFEIARIAVDRKLIQPSDRAVKKLKPVLLSEQQKRALTEVAQERGHSETARRLGVSEQVLANTLSECNRKFRVRSSYDALDAAIDCGLLPESLRRHTVPNPLTERDCEVLNVLAMSSDKYEIAKALGLKLESARKVSVPLRRKLRASREDDLFERAHELGLITARGKRVARITRAQLARLQELRMPDALRPHEIECLESMRQSTDTEYLAQRMGITPQSVRAYCHNIMRQLGAKTRDEALMRAIKLRLLGPDRRTLAERLRLGRIEWEIAKRLAQGMRPKDVQRQLDISKSMMGTVTTTLRYKLGTNSRPQTVEKLRGLMGLSRTTARKR